MRFLFIVGWLAVGCADRPLDLPDKAARADLSVAPDDLAAAPFDLAPRDLPLAFDQARPDLSAPPDMALVSCSVNPCAVEVSVSGDSSCARFTDGTIRCWGDNHDAQLGLGSVQAGVVTPSASPAPSPVAGLGQPFQVAMGGDFDFAAACAVDGPARQVDCWGSDEYGHLGRGGATVNEVAPQLPPPGPFYVDPAPVLGLSGVDEIALGMTQGCARIGGQVQCWGSTNGANPPPYPMGGNGYYVFYRPTPFAISLPRPARRIFAAQGSGGQSAEGQVSCALFDDNSVGCWGDNGEGQLGESLAYPPGGFGFHIVPIPPARSISIGYMHACAATLAGEVWCWGNPYDSSRGPLTLDAGESVVYGTPTAVALPGGATATQVACGINGTCALFDDGHVACWGNNAELEAGQLSPDPVEAPTVIANLDEVVQLAAAGGSRHVCALLRSGAVVCWGSGKNGALGGAATSATPVAIHF